jgi:hypothetical protein
MRLMLFTVTTPAPPTSLLRPRILAEVLAGPAR